MPIAPGIVASTTARAGRSVWVGLHPEAIQSHLIQANTGVGESPAQAGIVKLCDPVWRYRKGWTWGPSNSTASSDGDKGEATPARTSAGSRSQTERSRDSTHVVVADLRATFRCGPVAYRT